MARMLKKPLSPRQRFLVTVFIAIFAALGLGCLAGAFFSRLPRYVTTRHILAPLLESGLVNKDPNSIVSEGPPLFGYRIHARFELALDYPKGGIEKFMSENSSLVRVFDVSNEEDLYALTRSNIASKHPDWWLQNPANVDEAVSFSNYNGGWQGIVYVVDGYLYVLLIDG